MKRARCGRGGGENGEHGSWFDTVKCKDGRTFAHHSYARPEPFEPHRQIAAANSVLQQVEDGRQGERDKWEMEREKQTI